MKVSFSYISMFISFSSILISSLLDFIPCSCQCQCQGGVGPRSSQRNVLSSNASHQPTSQTPGLANNHFTLKTDN